jgi:Contractile injection system tube protein
VGLVKAIIEVLDRDAVNPARGLPPLFEVQFNPTEYGLDKGAQIAEIGIPGIDSPILQFIRGENEKLTLELFFDTTEQGLGAGPVQDVRTRTTPVYQLVKIQPRTHAPPRVRVVWGAGLSFKAIVDNVQQRFTLFNPSGVPLRATLTVTFREYKSLEDQLQELNLMSADHTRQRVVQRGDTLSRIAGEEYDDERAWRRIADHPANARAVISPRRLVPGEVLLLPPLDVFSEPLVATS